MFCHTQPSPDHNFEDCCPALRYGFYFFSFLGFFSTCFVLRQDFIFLCSPSCPGTCFVDQAGFRESPASASLVPGSKACSVHDCLAFFIQHHLKTVKILKLELIIKTWVDYTAPQAVGTSYHKLFLLRLCNFASVMNHNVNSWYADGHWPPSEGHPPPHWWELLI